MNMEKQFKEWEKNSVEDYRFICREYEKIVEERGRDIRKLKNQIQQLKRMQIEYISLLLDEDELDDFLREITEDIDKKTYISEKCQHDVDSDILYEDGKNKEMADEDWQEDMSESRNLDRMAGNND